jgi:hypothetical protein
VGTVLLVQGTHADARTRPSWAVLAGWLAAGAAFGLVVMIFMPPLGIGLAVGLPLAAVGRAWGASSRVPRAAYTLGAFGVGVLVVNLALLGPVFLSSDDDSGRGSGNAPPSAGP